jgi:hypothetical protein
MSLRAAVSAGCSPETEWVVFTNGDNVYHKEAFATLHAEDDAEAVAWDFYSRYHRPTGIPCERFQVRLCAWFAQIHYFLLLSVLPQ